MLMMLAWGGPRGRKRGKYRVFCALREKLFKSSSLWLPCMHAAPNLGESVLFSLLRARARRGLYVGFRLSLPVLSSLLLPVHCFFSYLFLFIPCIILFFILFVLLLSLLLLIFSSFLLFSFFVLLLFLLLSFIILLLLLLLSFLILPFLLSFLLLLSLFFIFLFFCFLFFLFFLFIFFFFFLYPLFLVCFCLSFSSFSFFCFSSVFSFLLLLFLILSFLLLFLNFSSYFIILLSLLLLLFFFFPFFLITSRLLAPPEPLNPNLSFSFQTARPARAARPVDNLHTEVEKGPKLLLRPRRPLQVSIALAKRLFGGSICRHNRQTSSTYEYAQVSFSGFCLNFKYFGMGGGAAQERHMR